ncbi:MAG: hypothetical protein GXO54_07400 [Chloroflexi bacterium]|nr:hypothetical protein [Chloroflexota bacterium]
MPIYRPQHFDEALAWLQQPNARPMGGGTHIPDADDPDRVWVDVRGLGLDAIERDRGAWLRIGATVPLARLARQDSLPAGLAALVRATAPPEIAARATVAGTLMAAHGATPLAAGLMALDANTLWMTPEGEEVIPLGDVYALRAWYTTGPRLMTAVRVPLAPRVAHRPRFSDADAPLALVVAARWPRGRTRLVLGLGEAPQLVLDGPSPDGWEHALASRYQALQAAARGVSWEQVREWARQVLREVWAE